jgi:hypothetical protein
MLVGQQGPQIRHTKSEAIHGRQDPQATAEGQEAEAGDTAADQELLVPAAPDRRYRRRQIELAEGGKLLLRGDGSIVHTDAAGEITGTWATDDPEWARRAIRFGLQPRPTTTVPEAPRVSEPRPQV